jgi:DNA-binding MarR family transcriptional regulator
MGSSFIERTTAGYLLTMPLLGQSMLSFRAGAAMSNPREAHKMAIGTLIDQQMAFITKFRELFKDEDGSPYSKNQIPVQRLHILLAIKQHPGSSKAELARMLKLSDMAVGRHLRVLWKKFDLLRVEKDLSDERRTYCFLNSRGEAIMNEMLSVFFPRERRR